MIVIKMYYKSLLRDVEVFQSDTALTYKSDTGMFSVFSDDACLLYDFNPKRAGASDVVLIVDGHQVLHWKEGEIS